MERPSNQRAPITPLSRHVMKIIIIITPIYVSTAYMTSSKGEGQKSKCNVQPLWQKVECNKGFPSAVEVIQESMAPSLNDGEQSLQTSWGTRVYQDVTGK